MLTFNTRKPEPPDSDNETLTAVGGPWDGKKFPILRGAPWLRVGFTPEEIDFDGTNFNDVDDIADRLREVQASPSERRFALYDRCDGEEGPYLRFVRIEPKDIE